MKTNRILFGLLSLGGAAALSCAAFAFCPNLAHAESPDGLGTWDGSGVVTEIGNKHVGEFTAVVTRSARGDGVVRTDGTIRTADGRELTFWQEKTDRGNGAFQLVSDKGAGGGCCFANGMCQSLESKDGGHAFASTLVMDGPDRVRLLITELENGKAVRFYAQRLVKRT